MNEELIVILQSLRARKPNICHRVKCANEGLRCKNCIFFLYPEYPDFILKIPIGIIHE